MNRYEKLTEDLTKAVSAAKFIANITDDGGTCNFDSMTIHLPNWLRS